MDDEKTLILEDTAEKTQKLPRLDTNLFKTDAEKTKQDEFRRGRLSKLDVCDAHPELLRAARNVGEARSEDCPICEDATLTLAVEATPEGQARNVRDVLAIVRAVPNRRGLGAFYWEATWTAVPGNGWDPADPTSGNAWENQALFDFNSTSLPALDVFRP